MSLRVQFPNKFVEKSWVVQKYLFLFQSIMIIFMQLGQVVYEQETIFLEF